MSPLYRRRRRRKDEPERSRFGAELAMLHRGDPLRKIVGSAFGTATDGGRLWTDRVMDTLAAYPTAKAQRKALETLLRTLEAFRPHGSQWRAIDKHAWVGQQCEYRPELAVDPETGEVSETGKMQRLHVPGSRAGGLARRVKRCPRRLNDYRRAWRAGRVLRSQRTTRNMRAIVLPHQDAFFGYAQTWLHGPPSVELEQRLRDMPPPRLRGFVTKSGRCPDAAPAPPPMGAPEPLSAHLPDALG